MSLKRASEKLPTGTVPLVNHNCHLGNCLVPQSTTDATLFILMSFNGKFGFIYLFMYLFSRDQLNLKHEA